MPTRARRLLLLAALLAAAAAPAGAGELKLATWSMSWLTERVAGDPALPPDVGPKRPEDVDALRAYADALDADVVALQQVDGAAMAARLFPPDRYRIAMAQDGLALGTGFAIRNGIAFTANPDLAALNVHANARYPLRSGADVTLSTTAGPLRLLAVHLKAGCRDDRLDGPRPQCATLAAQLAVLRDWAAKREAEGEAFVIAGDFNRWMDGDDAFLAGLREAAPLARATEGRSNPCWGGAPFADHILAGGRARGWMRPETMRVTVYREQGAQMRGRLSDHCPVSVRLLLPEAGERH